jgi:hypothetical protein
MESIVKHKEFQKMGKPHDILLCAQLYIQVIRHCRQSRFLPRIILVRAREKVLPTLATNSAALTHENLGW